MSGEIKVTFGELASAQGNISSTVNHVNQQLADLKSFLAPMVSTWDGAAAETYNQLQRQWDTSAEELNRVLAQIATAVGTANDAYQQAESTNQNRFA
ncbi:MAG TPA: WXG100 family type VII secretion target [Pseudonocardiaceae bacterium]